MGVCALCDITKGQSPELCLSARFPLKKELGGAEEIKDGLFSFVGSDGRRVLVFQNFTDIFSQVMRMHSILDFRCGVPRRRPPFT